MNKKAPRVKRLGDPILAAGDTVRLTVATKERGLADSPNVFKDGLSEINQGGDRLPLCFKVATPKGTRLTLGDAYHAVVTKIEHAGTMKIGSKEYRVAIVTIAELTRHETWGAITLRGDFITQRKYCGKNMIRERLIPVTVKKQLYRCDYERTRIINVTEASIGYDVVFQTRSENTALGTMTDKLKNRLPSMHWGDYQKLGRSHYDWKRLESISCNAHQKTSQVA